MIKFKKPRYLTLQEFNKFYPSLDSSMYRTDLVYANPKVQTAEVILDHINYLNDQDVIKKNHLNKFGGFAKIPLTEVLDSKEILSLIE